LRLAGFRAVVFFRPVVFRAAVFLRAGAFRAVVFLRPDGLRVVVFLRAGDFRAPAFLRLVAFLAVVFFRAGDFLAVVFFRAGDFLAVVFFLALVFFRPVAFLGERPPALAARALTVSATSSALSTTISSTLSTMVPTTLCPASVARTFFPAFAPARTAFFMTAISRSFDRVLPNGLPRSAHRANIGRAGARMSCRSPQLPWGPMTTPRERTEEIERHVLSERAQLASATKGRERDEPHDELRTVYQRDRDRIVHAKAFRRLKHKTQVFLSPQGDHYRVRLTHTLDVSQIARTAARALRLNEDLAEAIALGHDLGHTPFGHLGEQALTPFLGRPFRHSEQSLRVVDHLENDGEGLNLTWEVRDGIVNHPWSMPPPSTLEAQIVRFADRIAYLNHDVDDALRAGVLTEAELPSEPMKALGATHSARINTLVTDLVTASEDQPEVQLTKPVFAALDGLRDFMFEQVYLREDSEGEHARATRLIRELFQHFLDHPDDLPEEYHRAPGDLPVRVADYISGMTDRYAIRTYEQLFLPHGWLHDQG
jgi:dGTPase